MLHSTDVAVIGLGAVGSQALAALARRHLNVIGIDRYAPPHDRGSSHGQSRLIRFAYFEHPDYVPLVQQAMQQWRQLEALSKQELFVPTGLLQSGPPGSALMAGVSESALRHGLELQSLSSQELSERFPFVVPKSWTSLFEPDAGFLKPERCIEAALSVAQQHGAQVITNCRVLSVSPSNNSIRIITEESEINAKQVIITAGPWAGDWSTLGITPPTILRKHLFWYPAVSPRWTVQGGGCSYLIDTGNCYIYGMPDENGSGVKVARHDGGHEVTPDDMNRSLGREEEEQDTTAFVTRFTEGLTPVPCCHEICRYSMSDDGHFRIGASSDNRIAWASGLSGHGFKFASALGEHLAHRIVEGTWETRIRFLTR